ncbi:MAG TPA: hypothetical protein VGF48_07560 [Thermoanaerobaculia bacterium]
MKRVLFDENMPRKLRRDLPEFGVRTVQEEGWTGFTNGNLLRRAATAFDVLLTVGQRMRFQQNVAQFDIGIVAIETVDTTLSNLRRLLPRIREAVEKVEPGAMIIVRST